MQETAYDGGLIGQAFGGMFLFFIFAAYLYTAFTQYKIAQKCDCSGNAWWAFIPLMNLVLLTQMARKEWWWTLLCFVPLVNIVAYTILWINAAKEAGHAPIWGFLTIIPLVNFVSLAVMAFGAGGNGSSSSPPQQYIQPKQPEHVG